MIYRLVLTILVHPWHLLGIVSIKQASLSNNIPVPGQGRNPKMDDLFCPECHNILDLPGDEDYVTCVVCGALQPCSGKQRFGKNANQKWQFSRINR